MCRSSATAGALAPLKAKAEAAGSGDFSNLWAGQSGAAGQVAAGARIGPPAGGRSAGPPRLAGAMKFKTVGDDAPGGRCGISPALPARASIPGACARQTDARFRLLAAAKTSAGTNPAKPGAASASAPHRPALRQFQPGVEAFGLLTAAGRSLAAIAAAPQSPRIAERIAAVPSSSTVTMAALNGMPGPKKRGSYRPCPNAGVGQHQIGAAQSRRRHLESPAM